MLITTCSHCQARFRVTPVQLNAKQGQVRCGRCHKVFSGFGALERFPDDDTGARLLAAREAEERERQALEAPPVDGVIESVDDPEPAPAPAPANLEPVEEEAAVEPQEIAARYERAPAIVLTPPPARDPPSRLWSVGVVFLALGLAAMAAYAYRAPLAQRYPALRPTLEAACQRLACTVPWSREHALLKLEDSELLEVPGRPGEIALGARIRNLAAVSQEYPHLELTLTDLTGQAAARRVFRPADYLGRAPAGGEVLAPGVEIALQLRLATPNIKPTGYELLLFYP
jgi:predicted Zn finger-like uncharacterized protein